MMYQTYLKDCDCPNGIINKDGKTYCRWCRKPYAMGGAMCYEEEHFPKASHSSNGERDWEIVAYSHKNKIYRKNILGEFACGLDAPIHELLLHTSDMKIIYSVLRKSDGVVFTVGDRLNKYDADIKEFYIEGGKMKIISDAKGKGCVTSRLLWELEALSQPLPKRTKLFTTEDRVDIFEGDDFFCVNGVWEIFDRYEASQEQYEILKSHCKFFAHEENGKEYITLNKPILSIMDILKRFNGRWGEICDYSLKELAKSKL